MDSKLEDGADAKIQLFQNMAMLHIKLKGMYQYVASILLIDPLPGSWGWDQKVKIHLFQNMVTIRIKLKGMMNAATCKHIFCPYTHPRSLQWGQRSKHIFLKVVILHIKLMGMEHRAQCKHVYIDSVQIGIFYIELST